MELSTLALLLNNIEPLPIPVLHNQSSDSQWILNMQATHMASPTKMMSHRNNIPVLNTMCLLDVFNGPVGLDHIILQAHLLISPSAYHTTKHPLLKSLQVAELLIREVPTPATPK